MIITNPRKEVVDEKNAQVGFSGYLSEISGIPFLSNVQFNYLQFIYYQANYQQQFVLELLLCGFLSNRYFKASFSGTKQS